MYYKDIIKNAWNLTLEEKHSLIRFGFVPSFFGTIVGVLYIAYQISAFSRSPLFSHRGHQNILTFIKPIFVFFSDKPASVVFVVLIGFFIFLMYTFSPIICESALIDLIAKKIQGKPLAGGFLRGLETFFPVFEFTFMTSPFGIITFVTEFSMIIRNFDTGIWLLVIPVLTGILIVGIFLTFLFIFSPQYIVLENLDVISAIKRSSLLVLTNVKNIFFLGISMALIAARIVVNLLLVLVLPLIVMTIIGIATNLTIKTIGIVVALILGGVLLVVASYLMAIFHIFTLTVWTISFLIFRKQENEVKSVVG